MSQAPANTPKGAGGLAAALRFVAWLFAFSIAPLLPWLSRLADFGLISDYHRPRADPLAIVFAVLAFAIAYWAYQARPRSRMRTLLWCWGLSFFVTFSICFVLMSTVGEVFDPGQVGTIVLRYLWTVLYVMVFVSIAVFMCLVSLLYVQKK